MKISKTVVNKLVNLYSEATADQVQRGRHFYCTAEADIAREAPKVGVSHSTLAEVVACISPNMKWERNISDAVKLVSQWRAGETPNGIQAYPANVEKAVRILNGTESLKIGRNGSGQKTYNFFRNLRGSRANVTIDLWMLRAINIRVHYRAKNLTEKVYSRYSADLTEAARRVGETPRDLQAIIWTVVRER